MTYQSEVLADSPWGYWQETETSGTTLADSSPNGRTLTTVNSPSLAQPGPFAGVASVEYAGTANARAGVTVSTSTATVEMWIYFSANPSSRTALFAGSADFAGGTTYDKTLSLEPDGRLYWYVFSGSQQSITSTNPLALNAWHHVIASVGPAGTKLRVDAVTVASNAAVTSSYSGALFPSVRYGGYGFGAATGTATIRVAQPAFYTTQLSDTRTDVHYNSGVSGSVVPTTSGTSPVSIGSTSVIDVYANQILSDSPWGYWREGEGAGSTLADSSPNGRALTMFNGPTLQQDGPFGAYSVEYAGSSSARAAATVATATATIELWVYLAAYPTSQTPLFGFTTDFSGTGYDKYLSVGSDGRLRFQTYAAPATINVYSANPLSLGAWHHVVASVGSAGTKIRVDKVAAGSDPSTTSYSSAEYPVMRWGLTSMTPNPSGSGNYGGTGTVRTAHVACYPAQLSDARTDAHYDTVAAFVAGATAPTPKATGTSPATVGSAARTLPVSTGTSPVDTGSSSSAAPVTTGTGAVSAGSASSTALVGITPVTIGTAPVGAGSSNASTLIVATPVTTATGVGAVGVGSNSHTFTISARTGSDVYIGVTIETGPLTLLHLVALPGVEVPVGAGVTAGDSQAVVPLPGVSVEIGCSLIGRQSDVIAPDPRRLAAQWRYVVTDLANIPLGELVDIEHDPVEDGVGEAATMSFTIATDSDQCALIKPIERQCQVWEGDRLLLRGPILPGQPSDDGATITHKIHDPSWFIRDGRRVITRTPQKNLLHNGDFKNALAWWTRGFDKDSIPAAAPTVRVVEEDFVDDTDGLDPIKAAEIVGVESVTEAELSSNAVFWPNLATFRPGGVASVEAVANAMPTTAGLKVTVVGHTANDGTGNGLGLSLRRAQAAAAVIKKKRPGVVITTKGVGFYDPNPKFPKDSQAQRRVVIQYEQTISGKSKQFMRQTVEVTQSKEARYPLVLTVAAMLKVANDWSVPDANMTSLKIVARRKGVAGKPDATLPWDDQLGQGSSSISDTDPVDRWIPQTAEVTIPADGRTYLVDVYLYASAALTRYTAVGLFPDEMLYFWGKDQATIFQGIVEHIQKPEFGYADLGIGTRAPLTGVKRDREFAFRDLTPADTALDGLMGISRGLEWDTVTTATTTTATTFYPRQGKSVDYVLALGANVVTAVPANTRDVGSAIIAQAQGLGSYRAVAYANDKRAFGGTLIQRVITAEQDTPLNELGETARAELFWARSSTPAYWVDIDPDSIAEVLANTAKGDTVRLILDYPTAVDRLARIVRRQIHPDSLRLMVAFEEV